MIDMHCHIDLYPNASHIVKYLSNKPGFVLAVTTTPLAWNGSCNLVNGVSSLFLAAGLHPELVAQRHAELEHLKSLIPRTKFIGEIGLDGSMKHRSSIGLQITVFEQILISCEASGGRILSIHSRGASREAIHALRHYSRHSTPILHWFTGSVNQAKDAVDAGCWFSVGLPMLQSTAGQEIIRSIPRGIVLTETDGPFTNNKLGPLMPWHVSDAELALSSIWKCNAGECRKQLIENLRDLVDDDDMVRSGLE